MSGVLSCLQLIPLKTERKPWLLWRSSSMISGSPSLQITAQEQEDLCQQNMPLLHAIVGLLLLIPYCFTWLLTRTIIPWKISEVHWFVSLIISGQEQLVLLLLLWRSWLWHHGKGCSWVIVFYSYLKTVSCNEWCIIISDKLRSSDFISILNSTLKECLLVPLTKSLEELVVSVSYGHYIDDSILAFSLLFPLSS